MKTLVVNQTFESRSNINILYKLSFKFTYANYWTRNWNSSFQKQYFTTREFFAGTVLKLRIDKMYFCIVWPYSNFVITIEDNHSKKILTNWLPLKLGPGPWTRTLYPDPEKPGPRPWKTWTLKSLGSKNMDPEKHGINMGLKNLSDFTELNLIKTMRNVIWINSFTNRYLNFSG